MLFFAIRFKRKEEERKEELSVRLGLVNTLKRTPYQMGFDWMVDVRICRHRLGSISLLRPGPISAILLAD